MSDDHVQDDIEMLRKQVAELKAAREAEKKSPPKRDKSQEQKTDKEKVDDSEYEGNAASHSAEADKITTDKDDDLEHQFLELIDTVNAELKDASPATVIAVFSAGILVGYSLSKLR